ADADQKHGHAGLFLHETHVSACGRGEVVDHAHVFETLFPAGHVDVNGLNQTGRVELVDREALDAALRGVIRDADANAIQARQHVQLGEGQAVDAVHARGVAQRWQVEPAGATWATR